MFAAHTHAKTSPAKAVVKSYPMKFINLLINEHVLKAELALNEATADNIVELCRTYLQLLAEYRDRLRGLRNMPEIDIAQTSALGRELVEQARKAVRESVEVTVREHNRTTALLKSFILITNRQAAETLNALKFKDAENWEASSSGVHRILSKESPKFRLAVMGANKIVTTEPAISEQPGPSGSHSAGPGIEHLNFYRSYREEPGINDRSVEKLTVEEAVDIASRLRREAYIDCKITFFK
jgi:hypothetical protein